ncbi:MAG: hypothetical protein ABJ360_22435 [Roseobacter sp.]
MTTDQIIARARFIAAGEAYHKARKQHGKSRKLYWQWVKARAALDVMGI